jgi:hypothetical protein
MVSELGLLATESTQAYRLTHLAAAATSQERYRERVRTGRVTMMASSRAGTRKCRIGRYLSRDFQRRLWPSTGENAQILAMPGECAVWASWLEMSQWKFRLFLALG